MHIASPLPRTRDFCDDRRAHQAFNESSTRLCHQVLALAQRAERPDKTTEPQDYHRQIRALNIELLEEAAKVIDNPVDLARAHRTIEHLQSLNAAA